MHKFSNLSDSVRSLDEIRKEFDLLTNQIFAVLGERKKYPYNASMYNGKNSEIVDELYLPILKLLCTQDKNAGLTSEIKKIDSKAVSLLQRRILLGHEAAFAKMKMNKPIYDEEREKAVCRQAEKSAKKYGIDSKTVVQIMKLIIKKTRAAEEEIIKTAG